MAKKKVSRKKASKKVSRPARMQNQMMAEKKAMALKMGFKRLSWFDMSLVKLASMAFILFVITAWPAAMEFVHSVAWYWWLVVMVVLGLKPAIKAWF